MIDAVCEARAFFLDVVWDFSFEDADCFPSHWAREYETREIDQARNNVDILQYYLNSDLKFPDSRCCIKFLCD